MVTTITFFLTTLAAVVSAAPSCRPTVTPTLPKIGGGTELAAPAASLVLKKIAVGHGIQNYTCTAANGAASAAGAVAVLYDVMSLYPGTARGIGQGLWDNLPSSLLWNKPLPLNKLAGTEYGANATNPFPAPADVSLEGLPTIKFLGHHYFDSNGVPVFDLGAAGLKACVKKMDGINAPSNADKGIIGTGAVQWLQLGDDGSGRAKGLSMVYRVITAGGVARPCSVAGVGVQSVPYTTYYWFYG